MMKLAATLATLALACAFFGQPAEAAGEAERGKALAYTCLGCHGIDGYRNAYPSYRVPKLGGQKATYIAAAVRGYRDGLREHPTMTAQASSLGDQDIEDIAAYLATLNTATVESGGSKDVGYEKAETCVACHGQNGISVNPMWPTLAGQHEDYLLQALESYRDGTRTEPVMSQLAMALSEEDVALLARYFASLDGLETTEKD